ncbi:MAG: hypothetical protein JSV18_01755 [Candidatus Bathyarchaeota archaeon]|nr:MAG: hypothetical protein JSV18_01755 [Candidatus Bathyarchaeota archaeon]
MKDRQERGEVIDSILSMARESYSDEEAEQMRPILELIGEAIWRVQSFKLDQGEEPSSGLGGGME